MPGSCRRFARLASSRQSVLNSTDPLLDSINDPFDKTIDISTNAVRPRTATLTMGLFDRFKKAQPIELAASPTEEIDEKAAHGIADTSDTDSDHDGKADSDKISFDGLPVLTRDQESDYAALDVVADMIYRTCWPLGWMPFQQVDAEQWIDEVVLGVSIRSDYGVMRSCPAEHPGLHDFEKAMEYLNAAVAMKYTCRSVEFMNRFHV